MAFRFLASHSSAGAGAGKIHSSSVVAVHQKTLSVSKYNTPVSPAFTPNVIFIALALVFFFFLVIYLIL